MKKTLFVCFGVLLVAAGAARSQSQVPANVVSIFAKNCLACHQGSAPAKGLSWEAQKIAAAIDAPSRAVPQFKIIDTAAPESSYVLKKVRGEKGIQGKPMPPGKALDPAAIKVLEDWIRSLKKAPGPGPI